MHVSEQSDEVTIRITKGLSTVGTAINAMQSLQENALRAQWRWSSSGDLTSRFFGNAEAVIQTEPPAERGAHAQDGGVGVIQEQVHLFSAFHLSENAVSCTLTRANGGRPGARKH